MCPLVKQFPASVLWAGFDEISSTILARLMTGPLRCRPMDCFSRGGEPHMLSRTTGGREDWRIVNTTSAPCSGPRFDGVRRAAQVRAFMALTLVIGQRMLAAAHHMQFDFFRAPLAVSRAARFQNLDPKMGRKLRRQLQTAELGSAGHRRISRTKAAT